jgi:hypothetical protein
MPTQVYAAERESKEIDCMNVNVVFRHITLLTYTRPICITIGIVVKLTAGEVL